MRRRVYTVRPLALAAVAAASLCILFILHNETCRPLPVLSSTRFESSDSTLRASLPGIEELAGASGSDKAREGNGNGYHGYTRYYERIFRPYRKDSIRLVEIGVERGSSLKMWQQYFVNAEHIYGIGYGNFQSTKSQSCDSASATRTNSKVSCTLFKGDQSSVPFLKHFMAETGGDFDIIIDDGSHVPVHQQISFETLWPSVKPGGMYIIEDIETNWWAEDSYIYGYKLNNQPNVVEKWKGVVDTLNREYTNYRSKLTDEKPEIYGNIESIEFGQNIIFFYKSLQADEKFLNRKSYRLANKLPRRL